MSGYCNKVLSKPFFTPPAVGKNRATAGLDVEKMKLGDGFIG
jgi:hypothetical protein